MSKYSSTVCVKSLSYRQQRAKKYVNKRIAHFDENEPVTPVSFEEISECLEVLEQLVKKYYSIFNAVDVEILPVWQYDWKQIFREVWIPQE